MTSITDNLKLYLDGWLVSYHNEEKNGIESLREIDKLFLKMAGIQNYELAQAKKVEGFGIWKPPADLHDLKRLAGRCTYCRKLSDHLRICFLCQHMTCKPCQKIWKHHIH
jgi:hypothetical protein